MAILPTEMTGMLNSTDFSKPALSGHLRVLEEAGLIVRERRGQFVYFRQQSERLANTLFGWMTEACPVARPLKRESRARAQARGGRPETAPTAGFRKRDSKA